MAVTLVLGVIVASIIVAVWFSKSYKTKKLIDQIPGPRPLPLIGNAHQIKTKNTEFYTQVLGFGEEYRDYGILRLWLGPQANVAVFKAEYVEILLNSSKHMDKAESYRFLHPWLGTGLLTSTGTKWHTRRKMLTPTFHFKILSDFVEVFNEQSSILVNKLQGKAGPEPFNIFQDITLCALDIICDTAMGRHIDAQKNSESTYIKAVYKMSELAQNRMKAPWFWPDVLYNAFGEGKEHQRMLHILHTFTEQVIAERNANFDRGRVEASLASKGEVEGRKGRLAFLDMLLYMAEGGRVLSPEDIREEVDTFMFEGHDTTAAGMNWAVYLIGANKDVQERVHEEMDSVFGDSDRAATMEDLKNLKYLESCIKEALRLYPSVPMFGRTMTEDCTIGGYKIPKGATGLVLTAALHRDPTYFPDPEVFDPERFYSNAGKDRHPFAYVPFSAGPRNCIGQKFALLEEKTVLSAIFRRFSVEPMQKREELLPAGELILRPEAGIVVKLTPRK